MRALERVVPRHIIWLDQALALYRKDVFANGVTTVFRRQDQRAAISRQVGSRAVRSRSKVQISVISVTDSAPATI